MVEKADCRVNAGVRAEREGGWGDSDVFSLGGAEVARARDPVKSRAACRVLVVDARAIRDQLFNHFEIAGHGSSVNGCGDVVSSVLLHVSPGCLEVLPRSHPWLLSAVIAHVFAGPPLAHLAVGDCYRTAAVFQQTSAVFFHHLFDCGG